MKLRLFFCAFVRLHLKCSEKQRIKSVQIPKNGVLKFVRTLSYCTYKSVLLFVRNLYGYNFLKINGKTSIRTKVHFFLTL